MVLASLFASLITLCGWLSIPVPPVAFTLQTFGVLLTLGVLGGKWGTVSVFLYLLLGLVGLPVFSGFRGGAAAFLDPTGGFLWGFLAGAVLYWSSEKLGRLPAMILAQFACYGCGCCWYAAWSGSFSAAVLACVVPWLIPDAVKLWLAYTMGRRISRIVQY